jgi:hypothetical protein
MHFQGAAIDGPFQLYNALRRIQGGFRPGVDFQFFHGMGEPYAHYWLFRLFGGGFAGSELSRQLLGTTMYVVVFLVFFRAFARSWSSTLCQSATALALSWLLKLTVVMFAMVGMLGLRSALPTLLPVALYAAPHRRSRTIAAGVLLGAGLFMSTEQGIAVLIAYLVVTTVVVARGNDRRIRITEAAATVGLGIVTLMVCEFSVGGVAGMFSILRYNFSIVPNDQYWYFGVPPNELISSWSTVASTLATMWPVALSLIVGIAASGWYLAGVWRGATTRESESSRRTIALATLAVYGIASAGSLLGVASAAYAQPLWRTLVLLAVVELARISAARDERTRRTPWLGSARLLTVVSLGISAWTILRVRLVSASLYTAAVHIPRDHLAHHIGFKAYGIWPQTLREGQAIIDAHRGSQGELPVLWSTYSGWIEARNGLFNPSFDYMIHSLGHDDRQAYVDRFRTVHPALVQTMSPMYSAYEPWLENANWAFYDELLTWYAVAGRTPWSLYWERRAQPASQPTLLATITVPAGTQSLDLPPIPSTAPSPISFLEIDVSYTIHNPLRALPVIGASPRFMIGIDGAYNDTPVSLAPYETHAHFLLFVAPTQTPRLNFQTFSLLPGASFTPSVVRIYARPNDPRNNEWLTLMGQRFTARSGR